MTDKKWNWYDFDKLKSVDDLNEYFSNKSYHHSNYYHYTSLKGIEGIISSKCFFISQVKKFNDLDDADQFEDINISFALCFTTGVHENLPMWYMYSGIDGRGGRLKFSDTTIQKIVERSKFVLCECSNNRRKVVYNLNESDFEKTFEDVLYFSIEKKSNDKDSSNSDNCKMTLRYNNMMNHVVDKVTFEMYRKKHPCIFKNNIWYYEKETRLIIKLNEHVAKLIDPTKDYRIEADFSEIPRMYYTVTLGPVWTDVSSLKKEMYPSVANLALMKKRLFLSDYKGRIKMNLCSNCSKNICSNCDEINCSKRKEFKK